jgi:NAD(P)-dependent dehydrogenase (short-subunit alcohol dehydrogenase family)
MLPPPAGFSDAFSLAGHTVLLTGGSGGLGRGIAACMLAAGARVIITGRRQDKLEAAVAQLGPGASGIVHDVTDTAGSEAFAANVAATHGAISILINNAGHTVKKPLGAMTVEDFRSVMDTHVAGAFALTRAFQPQIAAHGSGSILFTASMASFLGVPQIAGYAAAKAAYVGLVRSLSAELAPSGVRVNGVAPGWIDTELLRGATATDPARLSKIMARIPMAILGSPEDVGWAMVYLASPAARYISGQILAVDGGALHAL